MIEKWIHNWEKARWRRDTNRVSLPFEWGIEYLAGGNNGVNPHEFLNLFVERALASSDQFFFLPPNDDYSLDGNVLTFPSAVTSPHPENNTVYCRFFPAESERSAVIVIPQWNADHLGHVSLCNLLNRCGVTALRLSMPYHEQRKPAHTKRAEYMVSANIGRTIQASRQAVLDIRRAADWLVRQGYQKIGLLGTSIGSCVGFISLVHDDRLKVGAFNHVSNYFADVVWTGLSTSHVRRSLDGNITLEDLRKFWSVISPYPFVSRLKKTPKQILMISAKYDLTFLPTLSRQLFKGLESQRIRHDKILLPCGHYTLGAFPFKYIAAYKMVSYLRRELR